MFNSTLMSFLLTAALCGSVTMARLTGGGRVLQDSTTTTAMDNIENNGSNDNNHRELYAGCGTWGDGTDVILTTHHCCASGFATTWISAHDGNYKCGQDPSGGWPHGTEVLLTTGWKCCGGFSYWPSTSNWRCGKDDSQCWEGGTVATVGTRTACCHGSNVAHLDFGDEYRCCHQGSRCAGIYNNDIRRSSAYDRCIHAPFPPLH